MLNNVKSMKFMSRRKETHPRRLMRSNPDPDMNIFFTCIAHREHTVGRDNVFENQICVFARDLYMMQRINQIWNDIYCDLDQ